MKMSLIEAVEFFSVPIFGGVLPIYKAEEVSRHCSSLLGSGWELIYRAGV